MNQTQLAEIANVSQPTVQRWQAGTKVPDANDLCRLADYFKVSTDALLGRVPLELSEVESISKPELRKWNPPISMADRQPAPPNRFEETSKRATIKALSKPL